MSGRNGWLHDLGTPRPVDCEWQGEADIWHEVTRGFVYLGCLVTLAALVYLWGWR